MVELPPSVLKAILEPSGDQSGDSLSAPLVNCWRFVPSGLIVKMQSVPGPLLTNAIFVPSGDHFGSSSAEFGLLVRLTTFEPSALQVMMSPLLLNSLIKVIFVPSGD